MGISLAVWIVWLFQVMSVLAIMVALPCARNLLSVGMKLLIRASSAIMGIGRVAALTVQKMLAISVVRLWARAHYVLCVGMGSLKSGRSVITGITLGVRVAAKLMWVLSVEG